MQNKLLKAPELANELGISRSQVYRLMKKGLPFLKVGGNTRFEFSEVMKWINENQNKE